MSKVVLLAGAVRFEVEELIKNFDNHGCGFGYDVQAQGLLRRLLEAIDTGQEIIDSESGRTSAMPESQACIKSQTLPNIAD